MNTAQVVFYCSCFLALGILLGYSLGYSFGFIDGENSKKGGL